MQHRELMMTYWRILLLLLCISFLPSIPAAEESEWQYRANREEWDNDQEAFIRDMLMRWRDEYCGLTQEEMHMKTTTILLGLCSPGQRYTIETLDDGTILFANVEQVLCCSITPRGTPTPSATPQ